MLAAVIGLSYVAMERTERVSPNSQGAERDVDEIKRVVARKYFFASLQSFPRRLVQGEASAPFGGISKIEVEGDWALVEGGPVDRYTCYPYAVGPGLRIYRKINGVWQTAKDRAEYEVWVRDAPELLVPPDVKKIL